MTSVMDVPLPGSVVCALSIDEAVVEPCTEAATFHLSHTSLIQALMDDIKTLKNVSIRYNNFKRIPSIKLFQHTSCYIHTKKGKINFRSVFFNVEYK